MRGGRSARSRRTGCPSGLAFISPRQSTAPHRSGAGIPLVTQEHLRLRGQPEVSFVDAMSRLHETTRAVHVALVARRTAHAISHQWQACGLTARRVNTLIVGKRSKPCAHTCLLGSDRGKCALSHRHGRTIGSGRECDEQAAR
ncbi:hypothetical protein CALCODRAFT_58336 [Calocera cornea HHB12733]|uniref:Uncharacterized protein n=1 Tax=Calocera cornea HHB12733 TaxID=1353952 RepID=A0A165IVH8_9BASI|nr:hypothetical protein CALCODRAFT_58336 [Calocera cornea HHB12733]